MKKLLLLCFCLLMLIGCASEEKTFDSIGKQYVQNQYYGDREKIFTELVHEDYFVYNYINNKEKAIEIAKTKGDQEYEENLKNNIEYKYVRYEVYHRDTKEEVDRFNQLADRNYSEMVSIIVVVEKYQNNNLVDEMEISLYLVKDGGKWSILRISY